MKKEYSLLSIAHDGDSSDAGDWSPHRSTVQPKESHGSGECHDDGCAFGEPDTVSDHSSLSLEQQPQNKPFSIVMPSFRELVCAELPAEIRFRCVSNDSLLAACGTPTTEGEHEFIAPAARKISMEPTVMATVAANALVAPQVQLSRPKRQRDSSVSSEMMIVEGSRSMDEDFSPAEGKSRKRRRLHERKPAMDNSDFAAILAQIGM